MILHVIIHVLLKISSFWYKYLISIFIIHLFLFWYIIINNILYFLNGLVANFTPFENLYMTHVLFIIKKSTDTLCLYILIIKYKIFYILDILFNFNCRHRFLIKCILYKAIHLIQIFIVQKIV